MVRDGLFQCRVGNVKAAWDLRCDERVHSVFRAAYSSLRGRAVDDFTTSIDAVNVRPPVAPFYDADSSRDWAHFDLTRPGMAYECVQGQVVLTDTTAGFRCSPRSHSIYEEIQRKVMHLPETDTRDWGLLRPDAYPAVEEMVKAIHGAFQIPILTRKGSMILWLSATLHSAKLQVCAAHSAVCTRWR